MNVELTGGAERPSRLFEAVAEYERAIADDAAAGDVWVSAREAAQRELVRAHPKHDGGVFAWNDDDYSDDRLHWIAPDCDIAVPIEAADAEISRVARLFGVPEALIAERRACARRQVATERLLRAPCADIRDVLEKFRALGIEDGGLVASRPYEAALAELKRIVDEASGDVEAHYTHHSLGQDRRLDA